jgi:hypothetical protein
MEFGGRLDGTPMPFGSRCVPRRASGSPSITGALRYTVQFETPGIGTATAGALSGTPVRRQGMGLFLRRTTEGNFRVHFDSTKG